LPNDDVGSREGIEVQRINLTEVFVGFDEDGLAHYKNCNTLIAKQKKGKTVYG
jgi:hypothetical protein